MDERRTFSSLVLQFTLAANLCTFFYLMTLSTRTPNGYYPLSMLVYSPVVYLLNKLFLSRPQTMRRLVLLNTAVGALFSCLFFCWESRRRCCCWYLPRDSVSG